MRLDPMRHLAVPFALLAVLAINLLANNLPLGGRTSEELSAMFHTLLTPAEYAFGIWGLIYAGLVAFVLYQLLPSQARDAQVQRTSVLFTISSIFNIAWLFAWHFMWTGLSVLLMLGLLVTLVLIYFQLHRRGMKTTLVKRLAVWLPFSLYLGWVCIATVTNIASYLNSIGWDGAGLSITIWALIAFAVVVVVGLLVLWRYKDVALNLVLVWGLVAIAIEQWGNTVVVIGAILAAVILAGAIFYRYNRRAKARKPGQPTTQAPLPPRAS